MIRLTAWIVAVIGFSASPGASAQMFQAADRAHAETRDDAVNTNPPLPVFLKLPIDYLDDKSMPPHERLFLADTLPPVDIDDSGVRRMLKNRRIQCPGLTCTFAHSEGERRFVIGYNPRYYAELKAQIEAQPPEQVQPSGAIKVIGKWKNKYPIYDIDKGSSTNEFLRKPIRSGNKVFFDPFEVIAALTPVERKDVLPALNCVILCADRDEGRIVGYDPVAWAKFKRMWSAKSQDERDAIYQQIKDGNQRDLSIEAEKKALAKRQAEKQAWHEAYNPPPMKDPGTKSDVPTSVIRSAITGNQATFNLTTWKETNTYVLKRDGEEVHYVEYQAQWDIKKENIQYVNSGGGRGCAEFCVNGQFPAGASRPVRKHHEHQETRRTRRTFVQPAGQLQET